jgi:hypothetical protein
MYFMKNHFIVSLIFMISLLSVFKVSGQVYTFNPSKAGCNGLWGTAACWDKNNTGCSNNNNSVPPLGSGSPNNCPVVININHIVNSGNLTFSGSNITLNIGFDGNLNIAGNMNVNKGTNTTVNLNGGEVNISGTLDVATGTGNNLALINISGNGSGKGVFAKNLNLNNNAKVNIEANGTLIIDGPTIFAANNTNITNKGFFRTKALDVRGQATVDNLGNGIIVIDDDLKIRGNSSLTVTGNSEVEIGGNIDFDGNNGQLNIELEGAVRVCGDGILPPESEPNVNVDRPTATYENGNCRILPVEFLYIGSLFDLKSKNSIIRWATTREWESSHFEIERAVKGIDFEKIGELKAKGWSDVMVEYEFVDKYLPLTSGIVLYRLKQLDFNGIFTYSKIVSVKTIGVEFTQGVWRAFPNPTNGEQLRIGLLDKNEYNGESLTFRIIQTTSVSESISVSDEAEVNEILSTMIPKISKGLFVVEIRWGQKVEHIKVLNK